MARVPDALEIMDMAEDEFELILTERQAGAIRKYVLDRISETANMKIVFDLIRERIKELHLKKNEPKEDEKESDTEPVPIRMPKKKK